MLAELRGRTMGTGAHLVVPARYRHLLHDAWQLLTDLDKRWSRFRPDSDIGKLNRAEGRWVNVAAETVDLLTTSIVAWHQTDGRFDPTVGRAMVANGYARTFSEGPSPVSAAVATPGAGVIEIDGRRVRVPSGVMLDVGGIGKGNAADIVVAEMRAAGADGAVVGIGRDVRTSGAQPDGCPWTLHLPDGSPFIDLFDGAVCMSTTSRRRWDSPLGERHHLVDPRTGEPTNGGLEAVAVAASSATTAEILTKSLMVAGGDGAPAAAGAAGTPVRIWYDDGRIVDLGRTKSVPVRYPQAVGPNPRISRVAADWGRCE